jgi:UDP-N-acetylmuramate dehydrogenase
MNAAASQTMLRGELRKNEPLARHTTWAVGGPARRFYRPADAQDLALFIGTLPPEEPVFWLGLGSNLLVRDGGFPGTVIATQGVLNGLRRVDPTGLYAEAGVACPKVARFAAEHNLQGGEFLAGIPGTVGGALAMNAGAFGGETWSCLAAVETLDRRGVRRARAPDEFAIAYRSVEMPGEEWFLAARFQLSPGEGPQVRERIKALLEQRAASQPTRVRSCGSVFRNPEGDFAARLIETAGLKGYRIGGACVAEKHANFILNTDDASAQDIETLIGYVQQRVQDQHGVWLDREVRVIGTERRP